MRYILKKVQIICPLSSHHEKVRDILIEDGIIQQIESEIDVKDAVIIHHNHAKVSLGWVDVFAHFCDPGEEYKENLSSGSHAALAGGFTDVFLIPNTNPSIDSKTKIEYLKQASNLINLYPIGAISQRMEGKQLAEMYDMKLSGAIGFSDGLMPVQNSGLLLKALQYVKTFDGTIIQMPDDKAISQFGLMHEGEVSTRLGLTAKPAIAESLQVTRDIELAAYTNSKIHFTGISTRRSIELIREAKQKGLKVTCSINPLHLIFTDENLNTYDSMYKVNPPFRSHDDVTALLAGIHDGTIDCFASHHMPQDWDAKRCEFEYAKAGNINIQTIFQTLLLSNQIDISTIIRMLSVTPRNIFNLNAQNIEVGKDACLTVFQDDIEFEYNLKNNQSLSSNSPFLERKLKGKIVAVLNNKKVHLYE
jgi:dihydroorotase